MNGREKMPLASTRWSTCVVPAAVSTSQPPVSAGRAMVTSVERWTEGSSPNASA